MLLETSVFNQQRTLRCGCIECALLRDNVQHHLEGGVPSGAFPAIHALADAPWESGPVAVNPAVLSSELGVAWPELRDLPIESLAISIRTRAIVTHSSCAPEVRGTVLHRLVNWPVPVALATSTTLGNLFGQLVSDLIGIARGVPSGQRLLIRSPVVARASTANPRSLDSSTGRR